MSVPRGVFFYFISLLTARFSAVCLLRPVLELQRPGDDGRRSGLQLRDHREEDSTSGEEEPPQPAQEELQQGTARSFTEPITAVHKLQNNI